MSSEGTENHKVQPSSPIRRTSSVGAATVARVPVLGALNPNVGLVVRGPAPGGLGSGEFAAAVGLPLLAAMRPEPMLAERLEHGGLRLGGRSPLNRAAGRVLDVLGGGRPAGSGRAA